MKQDIQMRTLKITAIAATALALAACQEFVNVPPNYIGLLLTPTGYDGSIYTPGQINMPLRFGPV
jgi:hypothetical protein